MTAHKHGPGAHVLCVGGEGYELLFLPGEENRRRVALKSTAVVSPRRNEYHQHFNTGNEPLRMLAFKEQGHSSKYATGSSYQPAFSAQDKDPNSVLNYFRKMVQLRKTKSFCSFYYNNSRVRYVYTNFYH